MSVQTNWLAERDTGGAGAIAAQFDGIGHITVCDQIRLHANAAMANENATIEIDSGTNAVYDTVLHTFSTNAITDYVWIPNKPIVVGVDDEIDVNCANTNNVTWGLEYVYRDHL